MEGSGRHTSLRTHIKEKSGSEPSLNCTLAHKPQVTAATWDSRMVTAAAA